MTFQLKEQGAFGERADSKSEGLSKKEKGLVDMDNSVVISGGESIRGPNGNGKIYNKG